MTSSGAIPSVGKLHFLELPPHFIGQRTVNRVLREVSR